VIQNADTKIGILLRILLPMVGKNCLFCNYSTVELCYNGIGLCDTSFILSFSV